MHNDSTDDGSVQIAWPVAFSIVTLVGLCGNGLVMIAVLGDKQLRQSPMNLMLVHLAFCDACNLILCIFDWHSHTIRMGVWQWGSMWCRAQKFLLNACLFGSISTQLAVCIERYIAIVYPMLAPQYCTRKFAVCAIACIWVLVDLFCAPHLIVSRLAFIGNDDSEYCLFVLNVYSNIANKIYKSAEAIIFYYTPLFVTCSLYYITARTLWSDSNQKLFEGNRSKNAEESLRARKNVVKMLVACVCVYFICYSPIQLMSLAVLFNMTFNISPSGVSIINLLTLSCSSINPLLFTLFSARFRQRFAQIIVKGEWKKQDGFRIPGGDTVNLRERRLTEPNARSIMSGTKVQRKITGGCETLLKSRANSSVAYNSAALDTQKAS